MSFVRLLRDCGTPTFHLFLKGGIGDMTTRHNVEPEWTTSINHMRFVQIPTRYWGRVLREIDSAQTKELLEEIN